MEIIKPALCERVGNFEWKLAEKGVIAVKGTAGADSTIFPFSKIRAKLEPIKNTNEWHNFIRRYRGKSENLPRFIAEIDKAAKEYPSRKKNLDEIREIAERVDYSLDIIFSISNNSAKTAKDMPFSFYSGLWQQLAEDKVSPQGFLSQLDESLKWGMRDIPANIAFLKAVGIPEDILNWVGKTFEAFINNKITPYVDYARKRLGEP